MRQNFFMKVAFLSVCAILLLISVVISIPDNTEENDILNYPAQQVGGAGTSYTLSQFEGKLAVFKDNDSNPVEVFDVFIENLPQQDRQLLYTGRLVTTSEQQLLLWIEDYIS